MEDEIEADFSVTHVFKEVETENFEDVDNGSKSNYSHENEATEEDEDVSEEDEESVDSEAAELKQIKVKPKHHSTRSKATKIIQDTKKQTAQTITSSERMRKVVEYDDDDDDDDEYETVEVDLEHIKTFLSESGIDHSSITALIHAAKNESEWKECFDKMKNDFTTKTTW